MDRYLTKCCWSETASIQDDGGNPESYYCKRCRLIDPEMELVEFCPYCDRPGTHCMCP